MNLYDMSTFLHSLGGLLDVLWGLTGVSLGSVRGLFEVRWGLLIGTEGLFNYFVILQYRLHNYGIESASKV